MFKVFFVVVALSISFSQTYFLEDEESSLGLSLGTILGKEITFPQEASLTLLNFVDLSILKGSSFNTAAKETSSQELPTTFNIGSTLFDRIYLGFSNNKLAYGLSASYLFKFSKKALIGLGVSQSNFESIGDNSHPHAVYSIGFNFEGDIKKKFLASISLNHQLSNDLFEAQTSIAIQFGYYFRFSQE